MQLAFMNADAFESKIELICCFFANSNTVLKEILRWTEGSKVLI